MEKSNFSFSIPEFYPLLRQLFRQELEDYFALKQSKQVQPESEYLTIKQASEFLHKAVPTLYGLVNRGEIPVMKRGNRLYFSRQQLSIWLESGQMFTAEQQAETHLAKVGRERIKSKIGGVK